MNLVRYLGPQSEEPASRQSLYCTRKPQLTELKSVRLVKDLNRVKSFISHDSKV